jgi:hypothetical protein
VNNVRNRNGESECDGVRHDASCVEAWLAPEGAGQRLGGSLLVRHFGGSALVVGGTSYHSTRHQADSKGRSRSLACEYVHLEDTVTIYFLRCDLSNLSSVLSCNRLRNHVARCLWLGRVNLFCASIFTAFVGFSPLSGFVPKMLFCSSHDETDCSLVRDFGGPVLLIAFCWPLTNVWFDLLRSYGSLV